MKFPILTFYFLYASVVTQSVSKTRWEILNAEIKKSVGSNLTLHKDEVSINSTIMRWKHEELDYAFKNPQYFNFSKSYFEYREYFQTSKLYHFIKAMPKGALLHVHGNAILGPDFYLKATYRDGLYICTDKKNKFRFSDLIPKESCGTKWQLVKDIRETAKSVKEFDRELKQKFTLVGPYDYNNGEDTWKRFLDIFDIIYPLWSHRPVWEDYVYEALRTLRDDRIMYVELRNSLPPLYELNGTEHDEIYFVTTTKRIVDKFTSEHSDFLGAKLICSFNRHGYKAPKDIEVALNLTKDLKRTFPDFIAGFDLVSNEDIGNPLVKYLPQLEAAKDELNYFFHAGETNWYGMAPDENLVDAVLLGSKRIGHAYALLKHPAVLAEVVQRHVTLEANVVSNSVLGLGRDVRAHPLAAWLAAGLPVTLASDDPGLWEAAPLSADFYVAFVGVASHHHDLRLLKQLALNSIRYSALSPTEKEAALKMFNKQWEEFVRYLISNPDYPQHPDPMVQFETEAIKGGLRLRRERPERRRVDTVVNKASRHAITAIQLLILSLFILLLS